MTTVYIYDSNDGDTQIFSSFEKAWEYAQENDWDNCQQTDDDLWLLSNQSNETGEILLRTIDHPG